MPSIRLVLAGLLLLRSAAPAERWVDAAVDGLCHRAVATPASFDPSSAASAYGVLFTASAPLPASIFDLGSELVVASLGFHLDLPKLTSFSGVVSYEVWTLEGHYADPERTNGGAGGLPLDDSWDHRGDFSRWEKIAGGALGSDDLVAWPSGGEADYFRIPFDDFRPTSISRGDGRVRSFYLTLKEADALRVLPPESWQDLHDPQGAAHCGAIRPNGVDDTTNCNGIIDDERDKPIVQVGEGVVSYPFYDAQHFYQPRRFVGGVYYLGECPTAAPSEAPTRTTVPTSSTAPTYEPTRRTTGTPSRSLSPTSRPSSSQAPTICVDGHAVVSTDRDSEAIENRLVASYGMLVPVRSRPSDANGVVVTSLGFHVDFTSLPAPQSLPWFDGSDPSADSGRKANYEVYALNDEGWYADPNRPARGAVDSLTFDHRGDFDRWTRIANGTVREADLAPTTLAAGRGYFQIPFAEFWPTSVTPNAGVRSFYLTLDEDALVRLDLDNADDLLGTVRDDDFDGGEEDSLSADRPPEVLIGEGVIGYPFRPLAFLYRTQGFVGKVLYERSCRSAVPSASPSLTPSEMPSWGPSEGPSERPSMEPTGNPSVGPSVRPSGPIGVSCAHAPSLTERIAHADGVAHRDAVGFSYRHGKSERECPAVGTADSTADSTANPFGVVPCARISGGIRVDDARGGCDMVDPVSMIRLAI
ncbi:hypothetical protein ACHAWF_018226 [Thalassiosira exigua]